MSEESPAKRDEAVYSIDPAIYRTIKAATSQVNVSVSVEPVAPETVGLETVHEMDDYDLESFVPVASSYGQERFGFVVTPNVDHMIRFHEDATYRAHCRSAEYVLLDSRFASRLVQLTKGVKLRVCTGSDLTATLFAKVIHPSDRVILIGGSDEQARQITAIYGLENVCHYNPPMGFIRNPAAVEQCLQFVESHSPFRFCFLAIGCPQQEAIAEALKRRGKAKGLALCVGASLNFLVGDEKRAPLWMQKMSLEWLYRLLQDPKRLAGRYLVRGPRFFSYLRRARFVPRNATTA